MLMLNLTCSIFKKLAQAGGANLGSFGFHLFSHDSSAFDNLSTVPPIFITKVPCSSCRIPHVASGGLMLEGETVA